MRVSQGALLAVASALTYGSLGVFVKLAYAEGWNVPSLLSARFLLAGLTVLPFALAAKGSWRGMGFAFLLGGVGYAATTALYFPSIRFLPAAIASFLLYLSPAIVMVLAAAFLRERITARGGVALALALGGLALLAGGTLSGELSLLGVGLAVGSAIAFGVTTVMSRRIAQRMHWARLSLGVCAGAFTSYLVFSLATGQLVLPGGAPASLYALGIGVLATGIPLSFFFAALARSSAGEVSVISTLEPVSTLILAAFFLGEVPGLLGIAGGALILFAAMLLATQDPITAPHE